MSDNPGPRLAHRLARLCVGGTLCLLVAGGLVTNTGSALAVPDWPTTFGENLFLFPWSRMVGGVLVEHGHRLLGALVGLLTLGLGAAIWWTDRRGWLRTLGALAVAMVAVQGLLGGLRVVLLQDRLAIVHGCLAQAFFALVVALAVVTAPRWTGAPPGLGALGARGLRPLSAAVVAILYGQIVLGALVTHSGWAMIHMAGAVVAVGATAVLAGRVYGRGDAADGTDRLARAGRGLGLLLAAQVGLGVGAYLTRFTGVAVPGGQMAGVLVPVAHRAIAACLLGATVALALEIWRSAAPATDRPRPGLASALALPRVPA